jgi:hypothetical protein
MTDFTEDVAEESRITSLFSFHAEILAHGAPSQICLILPGYTATSVSGSGSGLFFYLLKQCPGKEEKKITATFGRLVMLISRDK